LVRAEPARRPDCGTDARAVTACELRSNVGEVSRWGLCPEASGFLDPEKPTLTAPPSLPVVRAGTLSF